MNCANHGNLLQRQESFETLDDAYFEPLRGPRHQLVGASKADTVLLVLLVAGGASIDGSPQQLGML